MKGSKASTRDLEQSLKFVIFVYGTLAVTERSLDGTACKV